MAFALCSLLARGQVAGTSEYGNQFPDAPEPIKQENGHWVHDKTGDPPKWYRQTFTKKFVAAHGVFLGSIVYDVEMTHQGIAHHKCVEANTDFPRHPARGELYTDGMIQFAVMTGFDVLVQSRHFDKKQGWIAYLGSTYGTVVHLRAGSSWLGGCW